MLWVLEKLKRMDSMNKGNIVESKELTVGFVFQQGHSIAGRFQQEYIEA